MDTCGKSERGYNEAMDTETNNQYSSLPFGEALAVLLRLHQKNPYRANFKAFAREIGMPYTSLMSMVHRSSEGSKPSKEDIQRMAAALGVPPTHFHEYRTAEMIEAVETHPVLAGRFYELLMSEVAALDEQSEASSGGKAKRQGKRASGNRGAKENG